MQQIHFIALHRFKHILWHLEFSKKPEGNYILEEFISIEFVIGLTLLQVLKNRKTFSVFRCDLINDTSIWAP